MNDLVRWLGAQLDADERRQRGKYTIHGSTVIKCPQCPNVAHTVTERSREVVFDPCGHTMDGAEFIKTFGTPDPDEFVLADIAAKRRIIDEAGAVCNDDRFGEHGHGGQILRLLALPYAGRGGYDARWRP